MTIKYVEDYRMQAGSELSDTETIQAAVDSLNDGDTLIFNKCVQVIDSEGNKSCNRKYVLDAPVYLTSYNASTGKGCTRSFVTFDGQGCTVAGSQSFIDQYGLTGEYNKNALFYLSDNKGNGLLNSTVKNFIFDWSETDQTNMSGIDSFNKRNVALAVITYYGSKYFTDGVIENCKFNYFGTGIYQCGENSVIRGCRFNTCYYGLDSDGSKHNVFENNYFFTTLGVGLQLSISADCVARNNSFYKCKGFSIYAAGVYESSSEDKIVELTISDNKIYGRYIEEAPDMYGKPDYVRDIGIKLQGIRNAIVTGNHIAGISRDKRVVTDETGNSSDKGYGYGIGILIDGNLNLSAGKICISKKAIISNNIISECYGYGIYANNTSECIVSGNSVFNSYVKGDAANKYGIVIGLNTNSISVTDNSLYYYGDNALSNMCGGYSSIGNNAILNNKDNFFRTIDGTTYSEPIIYMPELVEPIQDGEYFYLYIPDNYTESAVTTIYYDNKACTLHKPASQANSPGEETTIPDERVGKYAYLRLYVDGTDNKFILEGITDL